MQACEKVVGLLVGQVDALLRQGGSGCSGVNMEGLVDLVLAINRQRNNQPGGVHSDVSSAFATRCTGLYVYGTPDSPTPGWLGKRDAAGEHVIVHDTLAYAAGNWVAGEVTLQTLPPTFLP